MVDGARRRGNERARVAAAAISLVVLALHGGSARADDTDAAALFSRGLDDMKAHRYATGCPALEESYRLDPHAGVLITIAECDYQAGKHADARARFETFLDLVLHMSRADAVAQSERTKLATERLATLEKEVPSVTLVTAEGTPAGAMLSLDGDAPTPSGTVRRVDVGPHTARITVPGGGVGAVTITLASGENRTVTVGVDAPAATPAPAIVPPSSSRPPWLIAAAVVGGVGIAAGFALGGVALADKSGIDAHCTAAGLCDSRSAASSANTAVTIAWASTAAFAVGLAGAGTAVTLWLTGPTKSSVAFTPIVTPPIPGTGSYGSLGLRVDL